MSEDRLEKDLKAFDYSVFSSVRETLLQELLQKHRRDNGRAIPSLFQTLKENHMSEEELDYVAAAGNPSAEPAPYHKREERNT